MARTRAGGDHNLAMSLTEDYDPRIDQAESAVARSISADGTSGGHASCRHDRAGARRPSGGRLSHPADARRDAVDVRIDPRTLREMYLAPFYELLVGAGAWSVMGSYNRLNGEYPCQDPDLYAVVKGQWGWDGFVAPDFMFAVRDQGSATSGGLDLPGLDGAAGRDETLLAGAGVPPERLADICRRILRALIGSGLFDAPAAVDAQRASTDANVQVANRVATDGAVMLVNRREILPLDRDTVRSIAVIGPAGTDAIFTVGGSGAPDLDLERTVTPLDGIRAGAGDSTQVLHAQGSLGDRRSPAISPDAFSQGLGPPAYGPSTSRVRDSTRQHSSASS